MKKCGTCKIEKPYIEFSKNKSKKDGYNWQCKLCCKQYRMENKVVIKEQHKEYYELNKTPIQEKCKKYKELNKTAKCEKDKKYRMENKVAISEYKKQHRKTEKGKLIHKASNHKRKVLLKTNTPSGKHWTPEDIILKLKLQQGKCVYCQTSIKKYYQIDHIMPVIKGGSNEAWNIQLLCKHCNGAGGKGSKLPHEFAQQYGKLF